MADLRSMEMSELVDMLAIYMKEYYKLSHDLNNSEKFEQCYQKVREIQEEIDARKSKKE